MEDNGIGMSEEYMKQVFEPFSRAVVPVVQEQQGTGLGMSIAHGIVSTMQGDIHVESRREREAVYSHPEFQNPGKGTGKGRRYERLHPGR